MTLIIKLSITCLYFFVGKILLNLIISIHEDYPERYVSNLFLKSIAYFGTLYVLLDSAVVVAL